MLLQLHSILSDSLNHCTLYNICRWTHRESISCLHELRPEKLSESSLEMRKGRLVFWKGQQSWPSRRCSKNDPGRVQTRLHGSLSHWNRICMQVRSPYFKNTGYIFLKHYLIEAFWLCKWNNQKAAGNVVGLEIIKLLMSKKYNCHCCLK